MSKSQSVCDVLVIGGGITGSAAAWSLAEKGADVILVEQADLNTAASGRNAGSLHGQIQFPSYVEKGHAWAQGFRASLEFLVASLALWQDLGPRLGVDLEVATKGGLLVCETREQLEAVERKVALEQEFGMDARVLSRDELRSVAPYISKCMIGAEFCPIEGRANPLLAGPAFARAARKSGARVRTGTRITQIDAQSDQVLCRTDSSEVFSSSRVICAAGGGLRSLARQLGVSIPLTDEPVQVSATEPAESFVDHLVYFAGGKLTLKQAVAGTVLVGGGWPAMTSWSGQLRISPDSLRRNLEIAVRVVPAVGSLSLIRSWPGVGVATPDLAPVIGEMGDPRVLVGIYPHMGFTAGPLMGEVLSQIALGRSTELDLRPFALQRF